VPKDNKFSCNQAFTVFILLTLHYYILKYCFIFCFKNIKEKTSYLPQAFMKSFLMSRRLVLQKA